MNFGETERDWLEWQRYESVINEALADWPLWGLCVFDTTRLPEPVLDSALRTHSYVVDAEGRARTRVHAPGGVPAVTAGARRAARGDAPAILGRDIADFIGLRHAVAAELVGSPHPAT